MPHRYKDLTESQRKCLSLVAKGASSKEIAQKLKLSNHTVDNYLHRAVRTMGAENRRDAAQIYAAWQDEIECKEFILKSQPVATTPNSGMIGQSQPDGPARTDAERRVAETAPDHETADDTMKLSHVILGRSLPIGGKINDLTISQRLALIMRLTAFSLITTTLLVLIAKGTVNLFT